MIRVAFDRFMACLGMCNKALPDPDNKGYTENELWLHSELGLLNIIGANHRTKIECRLPAEGELDNDIFIDCSLLRTPLRKLKGQFLELETGTGKKKSDFLRLRVGQESLEVERRKECISEGPEPKRGSVKRAVTYDGPGLLPVLSWLMKCRSAEHGSYRNPYINGLIIDGERMAVTDGKRKHVQCGMPMSPFTAYLTEEAADCLLHALDKLHAPIAEFTHYLNKGKSTHEILGCHLPPADPTQPDVQLYSLINTPLPNIWTVLPPLERAVGVIVNRRPLVELLQNLVKRKAHSIAIVFKLPAVDDGSPVFYYREQRTQDEEMLEGSFSRHRSTVPGDSAPIQGVGEHKAGFNPRYLLDALNGLGRSEDDYDETGTPKPNPVNFFLTYNQHEVLQCADDEESTPLPPRLETSPGPAALSGQVPGRYALLMGLRDYYD